MLFSSPYIKVDCPDGPRYILKNPEKAFSIIAPDWDGRIKALIGFYGKAEANSELGIKKKTKSVVKNLTENYAALRTHYQQVYFGFVGNPCSKEAERAFNDANAEIRKKEFFLRELEIKTTKLSEDLESRTKMNIVCPHCGKEYAALKKQWRMAGRPDKSGKLTELTIGLFDCSNCKKTFRQIIRQSKLKKETRRIVVPKRLVEIEEFVSKLKTEYQ